MTSGSSKIYHRGYRKGDIINIQLKNSNTYSTVIYSHITLDNEAVVYYNSELLYIPRNNIEDIRLLKKSSQKNNMAFDYTFQLNPTPSTVLL